MTAPAPDPGALLDRLEDEVSTAVHNALNRLDGCRCGESGRLDCTHIAEAVVALPEVADLLRLARDGLALRAGVERLAEELAREADSYAANVERLPTPTERASAAARAISHGGAADRLRAVVADTSGEGQ